MFFLRVKETFLKIFLIFYGLGNILVERLLFFLHKMFFFTQIFFNKSIKSRITIKILEKFQIFDTA